MLADGLDEWRSRLAAVETRTMASPKTSGNTIAESGPEARVDPARVRIRLKRLSEEEGSALELVFTGHYTVKSLAEELGVPRSKRTCSSTRYRSRALLTC